MGYQGMRSSKSKLKASVYWRTRGQFWKLNQVQLFRDQNERQSIRSLLSMLEHAIGQNVSPSPLTSHVYWKSARLSESGFGDCHPILFFFRQLPCLGGILTQNIFFSKLESWYSTVLNTITLESEKLSWLRGFFKENKSKVPVYSSSRNLLCSTKGSEGTQRTKKIVCFF